MMLFTLDCGFIFRDSRVSLFIRKRRKIANGFRISFIVFFVKEFTD